MVKVVNFMFFLFYWGRGCKKNVMEVESSQFLGSDTSEQPSAKFVTTSEEAWDSLTSSSLLSQAQTEMAQFPELSSAKLKLCVTAD